jgi:hypothetical protein
MFAFNRSALAVLAPLALLSAAVLWSHFESAPAATQQAQYQREIPSDQNQTVAANLPSR